jgi:hypothetical protein
MAQAIMAHPHETTMITICHDGQEIELEDLEHAKWALDAVQMSMEDGARGMEGLASLLQDIITECEATADEG